jgi:peroxiredoxin
MKKIMTIVLLALLSLSFVDLGFSVAGEAKGIADGTKVYLKKQDATTPGGLKTIDSVAIKDGVFNFKGNVTEPELHAIAFENKKDQQPQIFFVILEKGTIKVEVDKDSISKAKLSGTYNNVELNKYNTGIYKIQKRMMAYQQKNMTIYQEATQKNDTAIINKIQKEYNAFQEENSIYTTAYAESNPKSFLSLLILDSMLNAPNANLAQIKKIYNAVSSDLKKTKPGKKIASTLNSKVSTAIGDKAPDFSAANPEGKVISLKESLGKVTIIDFWASWCGPCRAENPNVVALYNEFHDKGLNIIGVSLDREGDVEKWKAAITKDKLTWAHVSNLKFWNDPIAVTYNIKSIPATFILDAKGNIVAKDLRGDALKAKIAELLAK